MSSHSDDLGDDNLNIVCLLIGNRGSVSLDYVKVTLTLLTDRDIPSREWKAFFLAHDSTGLKCVMFPFTKSVHYSC